MRKLRIAFSKKEKAARLLANLEELKESGEIDEERYGLMKQEYEQLAHEGEIELSGLRDEIQRELDTTRKELGLYEKERENVELRIKVGELSADQAVRQERRAQGKTRKLEQKIEGQEKLLTADSSEDVGGYIDFPLGSRGRGGRPRRS